MAALLVLSLVPTARAADSIATDDFKKITTEANANKGEEPMPQLETGAPGPASTNGPAVKSEPAPGTRRMASEPGGEEAASTPAPKSEKAAEKNSEKTSEKTTKVTEKKSAKVVKGKATEAKSETKSDAPSGGKSETPAKVESGAPVDSETSLRWLTNGNARFVKRQFRADGRSALDRQRLIGGEHPHAIVVASSDSRVPPELVFDQALGEIYVVRTAGETIDTMGLASIEDALLQFSPHLIVVMGHTNSHMVELATKQGEAPTEAIGKAVADIRARLQSIPAGKSSPNLEVEATVNADGVARELVKKSDLIKKRVESGELVIKPALYRLDSGKVTFY